MGETNNRCGKCGKFTYPDSHFKREVCPYCGWVGPEKGETKEMKFEFPCNSCGKAIYQKHGEYPGCRETCVKYTNWSINKPLDGWIEVEKELPPVGEYVWMWDGTRLVIRIYNIRKPLDSFLTARISHWKRVITTDPPQKKGE